MTHEEFAEFVACVEEEDRQIMFPKNADYSGSEDDALGNFKRHAKAFNLPPRIIWAVYANKHWDAVQTYVRTGSVKSEDILQRLHDIRNYCALLMGLIEDIGL